MNRKNPNSLSMIISITIHLIFVLILFFVTISAENEPAEFVTVGFGTYGSISKPGSKGESKKEKKSVIKPKPTKKNDSRKIKKVDLPKTKINKNENIITNKKKKIKSKNGTDLKAAPAKKKSKKNGKEVFGTDEGNSGFKIDFGGKGMRKIYSYSLPKYPSGVSKEIDIKLRFTILPDGTVGKVFPLIKADANLESVSISSLRQWRFEPLSKTMKQIEQKAVIVFPYRLK